MIRLRPLLLVPRTGVILAILIYVTLIAFDRLARHIAGGLLNEDEIPFIRMQFIVLNAAMCIYALVRFWKCHPIRNTGYTRWLMTTPWTASEPLPLGPLLFAWQDFLIVGTAFLLAHFQLHINGALPLIVFLMVYLVSAAVAQLFTHVHTTAVVLFAAFPATVFMLHHPWWIVALLLALYPFAVVGTRAALRHFPWKLYDADPHPGAATRLFTRLGPVDAQPKAPVLNAFIISLLAAWYLFCFTTPLDLPPGRQTFDSTWALFTIFGGVIALFRLLFYCGSFFPPISLLGRIATGKLIIPGYDKIFVAPLLILLVSILCPFLLLASVSFPFVVAILTFTTIFLALAMGPTLYRWNLTGTHRIAFQTSARSRSHSQRPVELNLRFH